MWTERLVGYWAKRIKGNERSTGTKKRTDLPLDRLSKCHEIVYCKANRRFEKASSKAKDRGVSI